MPSPVTFRYSNPHGRLVTWLGNDESFTPGVIFGNDQTVQLDPDD